MKTLRILSGVLKNGIVLLCAVAAIPLFPGYAQAVPYFEDSLAGYWKFDETAGSTAYDATEHHNNGTVSGAMGVAGVYGNALSFDGVNDYVSFGSALDPAFEGNPASFSVSMLVKPVALSGSYSVIIANHHGIQDTGFWMGPWSDESLFGQFALGPSWGSIAIGTGADSFEYGQFYRLTVTVSGNTLKAYLDGALKDTKVGTRSYLGNITRPLSLGYDVNTGLGVTSFNGLIDDMGIWNRVLDENEIDSIFELGVETFEAINIVANDTLGLNYTTEQLNQLGSIYANKTMAPQMIGDISWRYRDTLPNQDAYDIGQAYIYNGNYYIKLGSGLEGTGPGGEVPEPSTLLLLLPLIGAGIWRAKRKFGR